MSGPNVSSFSFPQLDISADAERSPKDALAAAWAQADTIREQARADGEAAGYAAGLARAETELKTVSESLVRALGEAAEALSATRAELVETLTRQAGDISLAVGEQIVAGSFDAKPELVLDVIRGALRQLAERHRLTILINPADMDRVTEALGQLRQELGGIEFMDVQADRRVDSGGAIVQADYGEIDASVETQLRHAREVVAAGLVGDASVQTDDHEPPHAV